MIKTFVSLFFNEYDSEVKETFDKYEAKINSTKIKLPNRGDLIDAFSLFPRRDNVIVDLRIEESDLLPLSIENVDSDLEEIQQTLDIEFDFTEVSMKIVIMKNNNEKLISIYSFDDFWKGLLNIEFEYLLQDFIKLLSNSNMIHFQTLDGTKQKFYTQSLLFNTDTNPKVPKFNRKQLTNKRNEVSNFLRYSDMKLLPNDFYLIEKSDDDKINYFFEKLSGLISLIFLSDISSIENLDEFNFKINGYKLINDELKFKDLRLNTNEIYDIYEWVFNEGTLSDKIGLARNIISLNYKLNDEKDLLKPDTFNSIKSGYAIYLKENVQQYIQLTNKMSEYLIDLTMKTNEVIKGFGNSFKNNNFIVASFFLSVIVFNSLSAGQFTDIFTQEVLGVSIVILIVSKGYLSASLYITWEEIKKFKSDYKQLKNIYRDLINTGDLDKIFDDSYLDKSIDFVKRKVMAFAIVWLIEIRLFFALLFIFNVSFEDAIEMLISFFKFTNIFN